MLTGEVAIQIAVMRNTAQPTQSSATRSFGAFSLVLMPAKNRADANSTTVRAGLIASCPAVALELLAASRDE